MQSPLLAVRRVALAVALLGAALFLHPTGADAQEEGVVVDPDSPAGKEYAIPLDRARREGGAKKEGTGAGAASRFGEGISAKPAEASGRAKSGESPSKKRSKRDEDERSADGAPVGGDSSGSSGSGDSEAGSSSSAALLTGGIALAVLLIGGAVALMTHRPTTDA